MFHIFNAQRRPNFVLADSHSLMLLLLLRLPLSSPLAKIPNFFSLISSVCKKGIFLLSLIHLCFYSDWMNSIVHRFLSKALVFGVWVSGVFSTRQSLSFTVLFFFYYYFLKFFVGLIQFAEYVMRVDMNRLSFCFTHVVVDLKFNLCRVLVSATLPFIKFISSVG